MDVIMTSLGDWTLEIKGRAGDYLFQAKITEAPSRYGIDGGRVVSLAAYKHHWSLGRQFILNYDREWNLEPESQEHKEVYQAIMAILDRSE